MKSDLQTKPLSSLADIQTGPFGSQLHKEDYVQSGTPIVTVEHLGSKHFSTQNLPYVSEKDKQRLSKYVLKKGDIVFSRVGSVDRCSYVSEEYDGWMFSGRCLRVRANEYLDSEFLYYYCTLESTKQFIRGIATGATMPSINTKFMGEVPIHFPSLTEQKRIASILGSIDDKIELNIRINEDLELQAALLLSNYCAKTPKTVELGEILSFENGFAFQSKTYRSSGRFRIITIKNVQDGKIDSQGAAFIDEIPSRLKRGCFLNIGDVLLSLTGNVGRVGIVYENDLLLNQRVAKFIPADNTILPWLYYYFRQPSTKASLETIAKGTAQQNLSPIETQRLQVPFEMESAKTLSAILLPFFNLQIANEIESLCLAGQRDTLLPKLMSGELDVSNIDI